MITPGTVYKHFKGKYYYVLGLSKNSESLEDYVVYKALYDDDRFGDEALWVRPLNSFLEKVQVDGKIVSRFEPISKV